MKTVDVTPPAAGNDMSAATPHVLVVEDEQKTRDSVAEGLRLEDWRVTTAVSGDEAVQVLERATFDLLILDWMLPGLNGLALLQQIRARGNHAPALLLTARRSLDERVAGLEGGADDYLPKPFALAELIARCRALLRRPALSSAAALSCGDLQLDPRTRSAQRAGTEIPLTPREVDVLEYLLRHQGQNVTREMLERDVWKQARRFTSLDNVIDVQMMRLRRKIDAEGGAPLIHTVRGIGYRLGPEPA
jgi:DNA-binding response OmpR family regulator